MEKINWNRSPFNRMVQRYFINCEYRLFYTLIWSFTKLGPLGDWGFEIEKNAIKVNNAKDYQTNIPRVFAIEM